ncbi:cache domain-containing protein [Paraglaciecola sp. Hal342]
MKCQRKWVIQFYLEKWNWMIGTGVYLDDVEQPVKQTTA